MADDPILVTGAAGFIGFHLAQRLLAEGRQVIGIDNINAYYDPKLKQARLDRLAAQPDFIFHKLDLVDRAGVKALFAAHHFRRLCISPPRRACATRWTIRTLMSMPISKASSTSLRAAGITAARTCCSPRPHRSMAPTPSYRSR